MRIPPIALRPPARPTPSNFPIAVAPVRQALVKQPGFRLLRPEEQKPLLDLVSGPTNHFAWKSRLMLVRVLAEPQWSALEPRQQAWTLKQLMRPLGLPDFATSLESPPLPRRHEAKRHGSSETTYPFVTGKEPARVHRVKVGDKAVQLVQPKSLPAQGLHQHSVDEVLGALERLPPFLLEGLHRVVLSPKFSPWDPQLSGQQLFDGPIRRVDTVLRAGQRGRVIGSGAQTKVVRALSPDDAAALRPVLARAINADPAVTQVASEAPHAYAALLGGDLYFFPSTRPSHRDVLSKVMVHEATHLWAVSKWGADPDSPAYTSWLQAQAADPYLPSGQARAEPALEGLPELNAVLAAHRGEARKEIEPLFRHQIDFVTQHGARFD